jgi:uncharacterized protein
MIDIAADESADRIRYEQWVAPKASTIVLQPTSLCNLNCSYCYLPDRQLRQEMPVAVSSAIAAGLATITPAEENHRSTEIVWHGGEPMAIGMGKFSALLEPFEPLRRAGHVHHCLQTNATLIDDAWCDLLTENDVTVGVSIDGPADLNAQRTDWRGRPAFDRITAGIERLAEHSIGFSVIAVVGHDGIERPEELLNFLAGLGCRSIGINIEECEGVNVHRSQPSPQQAHRFWRRAIEWSSSHPEVGLRDLDRLTHYLHLCRSGQTEMWDAQRLDPIPTVAFNGDVVLLSPELAGIKDPRYNDFIAGNVLEQSLPAILARAWQLGYVQEFLAGMKACQATCQFFDFCRGAQAGNRYFESGSFATTETNYCRVSRQELVKALVSITQQEEK